MSKKLILWSPHISERFVVGSANLRLYEVVDVDEVDAAFTPTTNSLDVKISEFDQVSSNGPTTFRLLDTVAYQQHSFKCMQFFPNPKHPHLLGGGLVSGKLVLFRFLDDEKIVKEFQPRYARACNVMAWNPILENFVAVGLKRIRNGCGTLVWDIEKRGRSQGNSNRRQGFFAPSTSNNAFNLHDHRPIECVTEGFSKVSNSEATVALQWVPNQPYSLAVGTGFKWLRIYDVRGNARPLSVVAHNNKGVHGVKFDPRNDNRFATFSEDGRIKLWDLRMIQRNTALPFLTIETQIPKRRSKPSILQQIEWCPTRPGLIATAFKDDINLRFFDLSGALVRSASDEKMVARNYPSRPIRTSGSVTSFCWHPSVKQRLLTVATNGIVEDISLHDDAPISWSPQNSLSYGCDEHFYISNDDDIREFGTEDISVLMKKRAQLGYSVNLNANLEVGSSLKTHPEIERLWKWMDSCKSFNRTSEQIDTNDVKEHHASMASSSTVRLRDITKGLGVASKFNPFHGIWSLFLNEQSGQAHVEPSVEKTTGNHTMGSFKVYRSKQRDLALQRCRWWDVLGATRTHALHDENNQANTKSTFKILRGDSVSNQTQPPQEPSLEAHNLENTLRTLEYQGDYEKATALALFHLDMDRALRSLSLGAEAYEAQTSLSFMDKPEKAVTSGGHDLGLVALALSGYSNSLQNGNDENESKSLWAKTCRSTLKHQFKHQHPHLRAAFTFLSMVSGPGAFDTLLLDPEIDLQERVAFACRFVPDSELLPFLEKCINDCTEKGNLDGLLLTGIGNPSGVGLIQAYINKSADIQTAAILGCYSLAVSKPSLSTRSKEESDSTSPNTQRPENTWIETYRDLLNSWQLWHERAQFDIARGLMTTHRLNVIRNISDRDNAAHKPQNSRSHRPSRTAQSPTSYRSSKRGMLDKRLKRNPQVPPQAQARCNYCQQPLVLGPKGYNRGDSKKVFRHGQAYGMSQPASKGRSKGCPHCKKPLPRCALCLVSLDTASASMGPVKGGRTRKNQDLFDKTSMQSFSQWFTWCQACRHGGHAEHISEWFKSHSKCPVTDCNCSCSTLDTSVTEI